MGRTSIPDRDPFIDAFLGASPSRARIVEAWRRFYPTMSTWRKRLFRDIVATMPAAPAALLDLIDEDPETVSDEELDA